MNKIIVIGLIIGCTLVGFCAGITWQYGQSADLIKKTPESGLEAVRGLNIQAQEPYQVKVYEDGGYVVQYHESKETETGCLDWGLCND